MSTAIISLYEETVTYFFVFEENRIDILKQENFITLKEIVCALVIILMSQGIIWSTIINKRNIPIIPTHTLNIWENSLCEETASLMYDKLSSF